MSSTSKGSRWLLGALALLVLAGALAAGVAWWWLERPLPLAGTSAELSIEAGTTPRDVAIAWVNAGVLTHRRAAVPMVPLVGTGQAHPCGQL